LPHRADWPDDPGWPHAGYRLRDTAAAALRSFNPADAHCGYERQLDQKSSESPSKRAVDHHQIAALFCSSPDFEGTFPVKRSSGQCYFMISRYNEKENLTLQLRGY